MTFQERLDDLEDLFGQRNAMYMRGEMRILFLIDAVRHLGKFIRKGETDINRLGQGIASIFARTYAYAGSFKDLPINKALCEKYPEGKCAYCQKMPCACPPDIRPSITHAIASKSQERWTVNDWCRHLDRVYGESNRRLGISFAHLRLNEEVGEVVSAQLTDSQNHLLQIDTARQQIAREFADVFAWIFSISAMLDINLDNTLDKRYPAVHHRCGRRPCICGPYYWYLNDPRIPESIANSTVGE